MSDYKLPELPSDDELGITDEDREFMQELGGDEPEMSEAEMKALLGDVPARESSQDTDPKAAKKKAKAAEKAAKKAAREAKKEEKRKAKEAKKRAKPEEPESDAERAKRVARSLGAQASGAEPPKAPPTPKEPKAEPGKTPEAPRSKWRGVATLAALIVVSFVASSRTGLPRTVPANSPDTEFSSSRALSTLIEIAREAHPPGSPEHDRVREYIVDRLSTLGLNPEVQTTTSVLDGTDTEGFAPIVRAATVRNVMARIPGANSTGAVLITAHYDGRELSVAANDDGVGVVSILEAVRALLVDGEPLRNDVIVLITDAEELGLLGARAFVDQHPWMADVRIALSIEMRGGGGPSIMFETNDQNGWVVRQLQEFDPHPFANSMAFEVYQRMPNDTDFTPFKEAGVQGLNFAAIDNAHVYHQEYDTPQALDERTLQHHGLHALAALRHFGQADLTTVDDDNVVYFSLPYLGLFVYDQSWVLPISGGLIVLLLLSGLLARRAGVRGSRVAVGALVSVAGGALAFGATWALAGWLGRFHPEASSLHGSLFHAEGWYVLAIAGIAMALTTALYNVTRRWASLSELMLGAVLVPTVAAIGVGFFAPLAAMNLQWPALAALVAYILLTLLGDRAEGALGAVVAVLFATPVLLFLVPLTELVWLALRFSMAPALAVLVTVAFALATPVLESLRHPNGWWAPLATTVAAAAFVGIGILGSGPSAERPQPSTLVYAYEHGTGAAVWAGDGSADSLDAEASAWAAERAGGALDEVRDLSGFAYFAEAPTASAPIVQAPPPEVIVGLDTIEGGTRRVSLHIRSRIAAEYMAFLYEPDSSTRLLSINGHEVGDPDALRRAEHFGQPDQMVELVLETSPIEPIGLHVVEHLLRPEELLGPDAFARPETLAPDITRMSDRAMFRYSIGAFVDPRHAGVLPGVLPGDSIGGAEGSVQPDSTAASGAPVDTIPPAASASDSTAGGDAPTDTVPTDTIPTDTIAIDTVPAGAPMEAITVDTIPRAR